MSKLFSTSAVSPMGQQVEKATSGLLLGPDWGSNMDICDALNTDPSKTRDVVKTIKKRLQNKDTKVQLLTLTLLETMMKNCGEYVHSQVAEKDILPEMVKIVKKKSNSQVRERALELLDAWQEAFGGPSGRYRQFWIAYDELRRSGVSFPPRRHDAAPPPYLPQQTPPPPPHQRVPSYSSPGYGSPMSPGQPSSDSTEDPSGMSLVELTNARSSVEVLAEMLSALDPSNRQALQDEIILELVEQCHSNQRRVMALVNSTGDEELLRQGLPLNDELQKVLAKYEALEAGAPLPAEPGAPQAQLARFDHEDDAPEEEDDFGQLAHRSTARERLQPAPAGGVRAAGPGPSPLGPRSSVDLLSGEGLASSAGLQQEASPPPPHLAPAQQPYAGYGEAGQYGSPQQYAPAAAPPPPQYQLPPVQLYHSPPSLQAYDQAPSQQQQQQQQQPSSYGYGGVGIKPIPGPPSQAPPQRTVPVHSMRQQPRQAPPPQMAPAPAVDSDNPFDEGNYSAPTFQASASPPPPPSFSAAPSQPPLYSSPPVQQLPQQYPNLGHSFLAQPPPPENSYVAPWAMATQQPMTEQQRALIYGLGAPQPGQGQSPSWAQSLPIPAPPAPMSPQQQAMLYGASPPGQPPAMELAPLALPPPPQAASQRQEFFSQPKAPMGDAPPDLSAQLGGVSLNGAPEKPPSLGKQVSQAAPAQLTPQQLARNEDPMQSLFGDLVDLRSSREKLPVKGGPMSASRLDGRS